MIKIRPCYLYNENPHTWIDRLYIETGIDSLSALFHVMASSISVTSHFLNECGQRSIMPAKVTKTK